ncbi:RCC1-like domain-containing protein [Bdellovibrio sp. HCB2-146]|uniref:RCC1-like domain-containing protein n=1 Tax=Bdellovibrio sp. HCB2-146 TaxID=3394362 RepID=UPI0039BC7B64
MNQRRDFLKNRFKALLCRLQTDAEFKNHLESEYQSLESDNQFSRRDLIKICASVAGLVAANTFVTPQSALGFIRARIMRRKVANLPPGLYSWGVNTYGQLGHGNLSSQISPKLVGTSTTSWSAIETFVGSPSFLARKDDGTLWVAGQDQGSLGTDLSVFAETPVQILDGTFQKYTALDASWDSVHVALRSDNTIWVWGEGDYENPNYGATSSPVQQPGTTWVDIFRGGRSIGATKSDGTLWVWGRNTYGGLGTNNTVSTSSPVQILGVGPWKNLLINGDNLTPNYALKTDGSLYAWGYMIDAAWPNDHVTSPTLVGGGLTWSQVASTYAGTVALTTTGKLYGAGNNANAQLGLGDTNSRSVFTQIGSDSDWTSISSFCEANVMLALKSNKTLWAWGGSSSYASGLGTTLTISTPVQVGTDSDWATVAVGYGHALGVKTDGSLWSWGSNNYGQLGQGDLITRSTPVRVGTLTTWSKVFAGSSCSFAIKIDGTLWTMGSNLSGQLGTNASSTPVQYGTGTTWKSVTCGYATAYLQDTAGNVYFSGTNGGYQLSGSASLTNISYANFQLAGNQNWNSIGVTGKKSLDSTVLATKPDGTLWVWGRNDVNLSGRDDNASYSTPVQIGTGTTWSKAFSILGLSFAIKTDGSLWAWGISNYGGLGLGKTSVNLSPVLASAAGTWQSIYQSSRNLPVYFGIKPNGTLWAWGNGENPTAVLPTTVLKDRISPVQIGTDTTWSKLFLSVNSAATVFAQKTDGSLWVWAYNVDGRAGVGVVGNLSSPVQVGSATDWAHVANQQGSYFIKNDGRIYFAGTNTAFIPNVLNGTQISTMIQLGSAVNWATIEAPYNSQFYTPSLVGLDKSGIIRVWGRNRYTAPQRILSTPVQLGSGTQWSKAVIGANVGLGIKTDGTLWSWGSNGYNSEGTFIGGLGIGGYPSSISPRQIGSSTWSDIASAPKSQLAIRSDGTLWGWGERVGSSSVYFSSPIQVGAQTTWAQVVLGGPTFSASAAAIQTDGSLWTWGNGTAGITAQGITASRSSPIRVGVTTWMKVAMSDGHLLAVRSDGTLWASGKNNKYQVIGNGGIDVSTLVQVGSDTDWADVAADTENSMAMKTNGTVWTWGNFTATPTKVGTNTGWLTLAGGLSKFVIRKT